MRQIGAETGQVGASMMPNEAILSAGTRARKCMKMKRPLVGSAGVRERGERGLPGHSGFPPVRE